MSCDAEVIKLRRALRWAMVYVGHEPTKLIGRGAAEDREMYRKCKFCGANYKVYFKGRKPLYHKHRCKWAVAARLCGYEVLVTGEVRT